MRTSGAYIAVYCVVVLAMVAVVAYGYWAWRGYRRAMHDALLRRHERDVELGEHAEPNDYWRRTDPHSGPDLVEVVPVALHSLNSKAEARVVYTAGVMTDL